MVTRLAGEIESKKIARELNKDAIIQSAVKDTQKKVADLLQGGLHDAMLEVFLESPEVENTVRQIYSQNIMVKDREKSIENLRNEFEIILACHLGKKTNIADLACVLFELLAKSCNRAYQIAIDKNYLSAHEATSIARHRALLDEVRGINYRIDFLKDCPQLDLKAIKKFEKEYRSQVGRRSSTITIPHSEKVTKVELNKIFVNPDFCPISKKEESLEDSSSFLAFNNRLYRTVLLGDPGSGKSTLAQKICYELYKNYDKRYIGHRLLTPVLVVLRDYSSKKQQDSLSFIQFMEKEVTSKYQFPAGPPANAFEYLLHNGHLLVIFDGLDELLDPSHRREISQDIESFCDLFPSTPVLITSRSIGYEQAPLNPSKFEIWRIAPFAKEQVEEYVRKWFEKDLYLSNDEKEQSITSFLKESLVVSDLRSNALMLALMCNLYRGEGFIPKSRPDVYKKCSEMLFERWDKSRHINVNVPTKEPRFLLNYLAYWIYSDEELQSGVTEDVLVKQSMSFLYPESYESEEMAEKVAREFIEFCRGRAWVFTDVGTTANGVNLYKFTHKTFLEYFTAAHIVRNNSTPKELWKLLKPKIAKRTWDVVAQLSIQMMHDHVASASDELLGYLLEEVERKEGTKWPFLAFAARSLSYVYPSPTRIHLIVKAIVKYLFEWFPDERERIQLMTRRFAQDGIDFDASGEILDSITGADIENVRIITGTLATDVIRCADVNDETKTLIAIELGLFFRGKGIRLLNVSSTVAKDYWAKVGAYILDKLSDRLLSIATYNELGYLLSLRIDRPLTPIEHLLKNTSPNALFISPESILFLNRYQSIAGFVGLPRGDIWFLPKDKYTILSSDIGKYLKSTELPCFTTTENMFDSTRRLSRLIRHGVARPEDYFSISGGAFFGLWCIHAALFEANTLKKDRYILYMYLRHLDKDIAKVLSARKRKLTSSSRIKIPERFLLSPEEQEFIKKWMTCQISFVRKPVGLDRSLSKKLINAKDKGRSYRY